MRSAHAHVENVAFEARTPKTKGYGAAHHDLTAISILRAWASHHQVEDGAGLGRWLGGVDRTVRRLVAVLLRIKGTNELAVRH